VKVDPNYSVPIIEPCFMIWFESGRARAITCMMSLFTNWLLYTYFSIPQGLWTILAHCHQWGNKTYRLPSYIPMLTHKCFFGSSLCCSQSGNDPQEDFIARFVYKLIIKVKTSFCISGSLLEPCIEIWWFFLTLGWIIMAIENL
jgi:hypothetical protein